ncbi:uncharacterized protein [Montipora foliosa]|uniref:uncharacterized protein n=1 Tax=Montipora foliosa TaxID=591990 RepID=UPI0035F1AAEB
MDIAVNLEHQSRKLMRAQNSLYIVRLERYLLRWLELSHTERSFEGLKDLIVEEQFIDSCPKELAIHLRERAPETLDQIAKIADQYLEAHGKHLFSSATKKPLVQSKVEETKNVQSDATALQCYKCNAHGHKAINCPTPARKCYLCGKQGHEARNCRSGGWKSGCNVKMRVWVPHESTGFSPFELLYGRAVRGPMAILKQLWTKEVDKPEVKNNYQYVFELREKLAHSELEKAQQKGKHYYDRKSRVRKFQSGEKVLVLLPTDHNKLLMQWKGPFEVSSVVGLNDYKVKVKGKEKVYHANLLKKYFESEETTPEGAVARGVGASSVDDAVDCAAKADEAEGENIDFLELGGYVAKESIEDVETGPNLMDEQRNEFMDLAKQFTDLFTEAPGATDLVQHHIKLISDKPVRSRPYPVPYSIRKSLRRDIADMIKMGVITEFSSLYASPVVVVKKKDSTNSVCVDYRKLNKLTVFDPEPMPTAEHLFQKLSGDKFYSKIDLSKG